MERGNSNTKLLRIENENSLSSIVSPPKKVIVVVVVVVVVFSAFVETDFFVIVLVGDFVLIALVTLTTDETDFLFVEAC